MNLIRVDIKDATSVTGDTQSVIQFTGYEASAMFITYSDDLNGAVYLMQEGVWSEVKRLLDIYSIEYIVLSTHTIED